MATGSVTVDVAISKPLRELLDELKSEVRGLRKELATYPQTTVNYCNCKCAGNAHWSPYLPSYPYQPNTTYPQWYSVTSEVSNVGLPCTVA